MKLLEVDLVRDREDCHSLARAAVVQVPFHIRRYPVGALVQNHKLGLVEEESCKGQLLLLARRQVHLPVAHIVQLGPDGEHLLRASGLVAERGRRASSLA